MTKYHVACPWEVFWGHVRTFGAMKSNFGDILGSLGAVLGHFGAPMGLCKGPKVAQYDKILCNIPMASVLGPFRVMQGHLGS